MTTESEPLTLTPPEDETVRDLRRAPRIKEEDVRKVADALLLDGGRPTVERVRARLGRGSPNTIALFLDRWWVQLGARLRDLPGQELPGVPEPLSKALMLLWSEAIDQARALLHDSLATQAAELEQQRSTLVKGHDELARARIEFDRERAALEQTVAIVQRQLAEANERHRADSARVQALQQESARLLAQHEELRKDLSTSAARLAHAQQQHQSDLRALNERVEATEGHWVKEVDAVRQALAAERKRAEALERQQRAEIAKLTQELERTQSERTRLQSALGSTEQKLLSARADTARWEEAARVQQARADEAAKHAEVHAASVPTFEQLERQLREVLTKTLHAQTTGGTPRRRFGPGANDKSGR